MKNIYSKFRCTVVGLALLSLSGCASNELFTQKNTTLPIRTVGSNPSLITSEKATQSGERLWVSGQVAMPPLQWHSGSAHVDVELIGSRGEVIAAQKDGVDLPNPRSARRSLRGESYVVSFPLQDAVKASWIRVSYHSKSHSS